MTEKQVKDMPRALFFVGAEGSDLFGDTVRIFAVTSSEVTKLKRRLFGGDLKDLVVLAWGLILDDELFDEFMERVRPAHVQDSLYRIEAASDLSAIYITRAIEFLNGAFVPGEDDHFAFLNDAIVRVYAPAQMAMLGIESYLSGLFAVQGLLERQGAPDVRCTPAVGGGCVSRLTK